MKKILFFFSLCTMVLFLLQGCQSKENPPNKNQENLTIYTTVYPLQYFSERIGGDFVHVETIYPPGTDEHTFDPSQRDMISLANADLFFYIGHNLEGFARKAEKTLASEHVKMVAVAEQIKLEENHEEHVEDDGHHHGDTDPHVWIDPIYGDALANVIAQELISIDPEHQSVYEENYKALSEELLALDHDFREMVDSAQRSSFIVSHAAYGYWESRYGLKQISIAGISSTDEPSQKKLADITDKIKEENIPYILQEQNINSKLSSILQKETGAEFLYIHNLAVLTSKEIEEHEDYFTLMRKNISVLEKALN